MISGKARSRALRAHFLAESALTAMIIEELVSETDLKDKLEAMSAKSRTAKLWICYLKCIALMKRYIIAE